MLEWSRNRAHGFSALGEFTDLTSSCAKKRLEERCVEAKSFHHNFELAMSMQMSARLRSPVPMSCLSRRFAAYPNLRSLCELEIDTSSSSVYARSTDELVDHIHDLASKAIAEREQDDGGQHDGVSAGNTFGGKRPGTRGVWGGLQVGCYVCCSLIYRVL